MEEKRSPIVSVVLGLAAKEIGAEKEGAEKEGGESASSDASDWLVGAVRLDGGRRLAPFARS